MVHYRLIILEIRDVYSLINSEEVYSEDDYSLMLNRKQHFEDLGFACAVAKIW